MAFIEGKRLVRTFRRGASYVTTALDGVSLKIDKGEFWALTGPSGSGKTTLLHVIGLLDPGFEGSLHVANRYVDTLPVGQRAWFRLHEIGFVFQDYQLLGYLNLLDNVALPHWRLTGDRRKARRRAKELLDRVGLSGRLTHRITQLSGGELQRGAVARALVNDPSVILADEPTGSLDTASTTDILRLFSELHDQGRTLVVASHNPTVVAAASHTLSLRDGRVD